MSHNDTRRHLRVLSQLAAKHRSNAIGFVNSVERRHLAEYQLECHDALTYALTELKAMGVEQEAAE